MHSSVLTSKGTRTTILDYASLVEELYISHIVFEAPSSNCPLQSWTDIKDIIHLCRDTLTRISLVIGDDSFSDLPLNHSYFHPKTILPCLKHLEVASKCPNLPEQLIVELLRAAPVNGLSSIRLPKLLGNFSSTGWFLISERGGSELRDIELTPSVGFNMLGWDETCFHDGLEKVIKMAPKLKFFDLSGHGMGLSPKMLGKFITDLELEYVFLPSGLDDSHLITILTGPPWSSLKMLGFMQTSFETPLSFFNFSDQMMKALIEHLNLIPRQKLQLILPQFLRSVKSGKPLDIVDFLNQLPGCKQAPENSSLWVFKEKIYISAPNKKLVRARDLII